MDPPQYSKLLLSEISNEGDGDKTPMKFGEKRHRSENWNDEDRELLKDLIKKRVKVIENKNTDTNTNKLKKAAWMELVDDFNSLCTSGIRNLTQLRSQWSTIKMTAKKEMLSYRKQAKLTGGGPPTSLAALSGNDIAVWLPEEFVIDDNEFDSDVIFSKKDASEKTNSVDENLVKIAEVDVACRKELHSLRMEVERKRIRNLDLEHELLKMRLKYYKQTVDKIDPF
uniref:Regulatory protein zeste n=1 Tax=Stomoxys calcitrans TaxID=35570 RepID=A0A1I8Q2D2_STOCA